MPAELYIKRAKKPFDIIFLDPPFPYQYKRELITGIAESALAANETRILIHRPREDGAFEDQKEEIQQMEKKNSREYGRSVVDFFTIKKSRTV
jgi:16S rRNA G966 N2-methylase RsmD